MDPLAEQLLVEGHEAPTAEGKAAWNVSPFAGRPFCVPRLLCPGSGRACGGPVTQEDGRSPERVRITRIPVSTEAPACAAVRWAPFHTTHSIPYPNKGGVRGESRLIR